MQSQQPKDDSLTTTGETLSRESAVSTTTAGVSDAAVTEMSLTTTTTTTVTASTPLQSAAVSTAATQSETEGVPADARGNTPLPSLRRHEEEDVDDNCTRQTDGGAPGHGNHIIGSGTASPPSSSPPSPSSGRVFNWKREKTDPRDYLFGATSSNFRSSNVPLPPRVDLSTEMPPVLDQGNLGACVSNSCSNCLQFCLRKQRQIPFVPSRLYIYWHGRLLAGLPLDQDTGLQIRDAAKSVAKYHACDEKHCPYYVSRFAQKPSQTAYANAKTHTRLSYLRVNQDLFSLKTALSEGFPVQFGYMVYSSSLTRTVDLTGAIPMPNKVPNDRVKGGHSVCLVGYDDTKQVFFFQNSWGQSWGKLGYGTIPYAYVTNANLASDFWTYRLFA